MKSLIIAFTTLISASVFAWPGADIYMTRIICQSAQPSSDNSTTVKVLEGGVSGIPQLQISHSTLVGPRTKTFAAKKVVSDRVGAPVAYEAPGIRLSVNFTVAPKNGQFPGTLAFQANSESSVVYEQLLCSQVK